MIRMSTTMDEIDKRLLKKLKSPKGDNQKLSFIGDQPLKRHEQMVITWTKQAI